LQKATWTETEKGEDVSEYKPEGATHLQDEKPPDEEIEPEELLEVTAGALSARASVPDRPDPPFAQLHAGLACGRSFGDYDSHRGGLARSEHSIAQEPS
jgi:hypothetical protein